MDMKEKKTGKGNNFPTNCREVQQMKDMEINEKIRYFRKQRGLSQELLAERTGINVNTIRKYEIGIRKPKVEQLKKIADGLEISVIEFLDIEIENEADLIAMLKKISPFFKWDGLLHVLVEVGSMLAKGSPMTDENGKIVWDKEGKVIYEPYKIKVLNTINFKKSMHYNPFVYIRSEKDILKLVTTIIANTKGEGQQSGEDFWVSATRSQTVKSLRTSNGFPLFGELVV